MPRNVAKVVLKAEKFYLESVSVVGVFYYDNFKRKKTVLSTEVQWKTPYEAADL